MQSERPLPIPIPPLPTEHLPTDPTSGNIFDEVSLSGVRELLSLMRLLIDRLEDRVEQLASPVHRN